MGLRVSQRRPVVVDPHLCTGSANTGGSADPAGRVSAEITVLVAGGRAAAVHALLTAMFTAGQRLPHAPRDTYLVIRGTAGHQPLPALGDFDGDGRQPLIRRRPRRVDLAVTDSLLELFTIVAARAVTARDGESGLVADLVAHSNCLVLVTDGRFPYQPAELDLLHSATVRGLPIFLAVTHVDETAAWAEVVQANQAKLARNFPGLAMHPWYPVTRTRSGVPDLRAALIAWSANHRSSRGARRRVPALRVAADAANSGWPDLLHREVVGAHAETLHRVETHLRALRPSTSSAPRRVPHPAETPNATQTPTPTLSPARDHPPAGGAHQSDSASPAEVLEQGLQAVSLVLNRDLRRTVDRMLESLLGAVLVRPPDAEALERTRMALRREVAERIADLPICYRSLWVTRTAVVAVASSREPVAALAAHTEPLGAVLPPLGVGLTANCLPQLQAQQLEWSPQAWVERAVSAVQVELTQELSRQFGHLHQAIADLIVDAIDHDLLLV